MCTGLEVAVLAGAAFSAAGSVSEGRAAKKESQFRAGVAEQQAAREVQVSTETERDFRKRQAALFAERRAALGASGVRQDTGSPLLTQQDFLDETELQALRIREGGELRATRLEQEADFMRRAGRSAQKRGIFRAGSSLLSGVGTAFG